MASVVENKKPAVSEQDVELVRTLEELAKNRIQRKAAEEKWVAQRRQCHELQSETSRICRGLKSHITRATRRRSVILSKGRVAIIVCHDEDAHMMEDGGVHVEFFDEGGVPINFDVNLMPGQRPNGTNRC